MVTENKVFKTSFTKSRFRALNARMYMGKKKVKNIIALTLLLTSIQRKEFFEDCIENVLQEEKEIYLLGDVKCQDKQCLELIC